MKPLATYQLMKQLQAERVSKRMSGSLNVKQCLCNQITMLVKKIICCWCVMGPQNSHDLHLDIGDILWTHKLHQLHQASYCLK